MNDRTAILLGAVAGAVVGAACGYLFLTERGRALRDGLEPRLTDLMTELGRARGTAARARAAFDDVAAPPRPYGPR